MMQIACQSYHGAGVATLAKRERWRSHPSVADAVTSVGLLHPCHRKVESRWRHRALETTADDRRTINNFTTDEQENLWGLRAVRFPSNYPVRLLQDMTVKTARPGEGLLSMRGTRVPPDDGAAVLSNGHIFRE